MRELWQSKKFKTALLGFVVASAGVIARQRGMDISNEEILMAITPLTAYIVGQGISDHGKGKEKK